MDMLKELEAWVEEWGTAPLYEEMPRKTLADKGAAGPTAAHALEEIHTPLNIAYTTYTTGTSAFQNPVGIVYEELPEAVKIELEENTQFWARYEGKTAEAAEAVNDAYLKVNGQAEGVKTYGRVVDLMLEDFVKNRRAQ